MGRAAQPEEIVGMVLYLAGLGQGEQVTPAQVAASAVRRPDLEPGEPGEPGRRFDGVHRRWPQ